jgi:hypothetical protein
MKERTKKASIDTSTETYERALEYHQENNLKLKIRLLQLNSNIEECETNINYPHEKRRTDFLKYLKEHNETDQLLQNIQNSILELKATIKACKSHY